MKSTNYKKIISVIVILILFLGVLYSLNPTFKEYYDSYGYWICFTGNKVRLSRGYVFPGVLALFSLIGDNGPMVWYIVSVLLLAVFFVYGFDKIWSDKCEGKKAVISPIIIALVLAVFFGGLFSFALSDLWAFCIAVISYRFLARVDSTNKVSMNILWGLLAGITAYMAYNVRTIYLFFIFGLIALMVYDLIRTKKPVQFLVKVLTMGVGCAIAAIPQIYLNWTYKGIISAAVPTDNLFGQQLVWGMQYQAYGTYVGPGIKEPAVRFMDQSGLNIIAAEGLDGETTVTVLEYIKLAVKYPMEMLGIYVRHFINMLFPAWPETYIMDFSNYKIVYAVVAFTIFFLFLVVLLRKKLVNSQTQLRLLVFMIPVLAITPGAVESRFFMPLFLYMTGTLCYNTKLKEIWDDFKKNKVMYIVSCVGLFSMMVAIWTSMLASYAEDYMIFME